MGVASGITIQASAEWAALIPLADGGNQIVHGLTLMRVTGDMPKVNMKKLFHLQLHHKEHKFCTLDRQHLQGHGIESI